jgi:hypothetical protein
MNMPFTDALYSSTRADVSYLAQVISQPDGAEVTYGPYYTGNVSAVQLNLAGSAPGSLHKLDFYADEALTMFMAGHQAEVNNNGSMNVAFPVLGAWMVWRVTPLAAGPFPFTATARLSSAPHLGKPNNGPAKNLIIGGTGNILAGATVTNFSAVTAPGEAFWTAGYTGNDAGAWEAFLESGSVLAGTFQNIDYQDSRSGRVARKVYLPSRPVRLRLVNLDGAAPHPYYFAVGTSLGF